MLRTGSYDLPPAKTVEDRFWEKVKKDGPVPQHRPELGPCWIWDASTYWNGYGQFRHPKAPAGTSGLAHRAAWIFERGPIDEGLHVDHLCRTHPCVRTSHLEPVLRRTNIIRGESFSARNSRKTHCDRGHEYTPENTIWENGWRKCRDCRRITAKERYDQKKAAR